jgi:succinate dehydrogenase / fumarate reductase iron-sulfur subunit
MCHYHDGYAGPAALNRAFTLLADSRDALYEERLSRAMDSCYQCRTELNCTEVCPKGISGTRAIKYIQLLALKGRRDDARPAAATPAAASAAGAPEDPAAPSPVEAAHAMDRRGFLQRAGIGLFGIGSALALGGVAARAMIEPALAKTPSRWVPVGALDRMRDGDVTTVVMEYDASSGLYRQQVSAPVLVSRAGGELVCFKASCTHLGCTVRWEPLSGRFRCACHGGTFDRDGSVLGGPPPRPLDRYRFKVDSGQLLVEVSA